MNQHRYRLIFDHLRHCLIAVSELARSQRKASSSTRCVTSSLPAPRYEGSLLLSLGLMILGIAARAQIVPDRNAPASQQPVIVSAPNGVPLVNIQTPSAGGVSRNVYEKFDVLREGVILNNSRTAVQTQLGGWVPGNANIGAKPASVILNEVNASTPSLLQGAAEVAGQRAQVIIANGVGITCNGCGFINAQRATLTTGQPVVNNGNLDGYRVTDGTVRIEGVGLNASSADYADLIARAVILNAGLWAKELHITTGINQVNAANAQAMPLPAAGKSPTFALDVGQLGGMYAGKIQLIGTEAGLGVRNAGLIGAGAGEVVLRVDGKLENRSKIYGDHIAISASEVVNAADSTSDTSAAPVIAARERLDIGTGRLINREHALVASLGNMAIGRSLDDAHQASGTADLVENASASIDAASDLTLAAKEVRNLNLHFSTSTEEVSREQLVEYSSPQSPIRYSSTDPAVYPIHDEIWKLMTPQGMLEPWTKYQFERVAIETRIKTTDPAQIIAGGSIQLRAGKLLNERSRFLAGDKIIGDIGTLNNIDTQGQRTVTDTGTATNYWRRHRSGADATDTSTADYGPVIKVTGVDLKAFSYQQNSAADVATARGGSSDTVRSQLFRQAPDPTAGYLIETDPAFTNYRQWLASDYLLRQLAIDPATLQKRLGDGFYEQQRVREQVAQLTGRRFLEGYASDEAQYQALMNQAATFAHAHQLRPGIALSKEQVAQLTSDIVWLVEQDVTLPSGAHQRALVPQVYVVPREGDLNAQGALLSGQNIQLNVSGDIVNSGTVAGRQLLTLTSDNLRNEGGRISGTDVAIGARKDMDNIGGTIAASQSLIAMAGRDIQSTATTHTSSTESRSARHSSTNIERVAGLYVTGDKGMLIASAGRDLNLNAAAVVNQGKQSQTLLAAGRDLNVDTVTEATSNQTTWDRNNWRKDSSSTEIGSQIRAEATLQLSAGNDVNLKAADVTSRTGNINITAGRNVDITTAEKRATVEEAHRHKESGTFSSTTRTSRDSIDQRSAEATVISGQSVHINAGQQISVTGSDIVSTEGTALAAGTNVVIDSTREQRKESHIYKEQSSGLMGSGGFGVTLGSRTLSSNGHSTEQIARGATIGSTDGDVQINAAQNYQQRGSKVTAPGGDVRITAQRVDITEARETRSNQSETHFEQSGVTVAISNPVITAVQTAQQMTQAAGDTKDNRMKALAAANIAMTTANAADAVKAGQGSTINGKDQQVATAHDANGNPIESKDANAADKLGGVSVNISVGSSKSRSNSTSTSDTAKASHVQASGNIDIAAKDAGTESDVIIQGSELNAGKRINLEADSEITLRAAANTSEQHSANSSKSGSIGVGIHLGAKGGIGITASASQGNGHADGTDTSWSNTQATAGEQSNLRSGSDTNLIGAVISSPKVSAEVGGHLNIISLQDSSRYDSKQASIGGSATVGSAPSANLSLSNSRIDSDYTSVKQQSALRAGDSGFDVKVAGNTVLKAGVITSTEKAHADQRNQFSTGGTLSTEDLQNRASYEASTTSINLGSGFSAQGKLTPTGTSAGIGRDSDQASSTTRASITGIVGDTNARTGEQETGIAKIFDAGKVQREINAQSQITQTFTREAPKFIGDYAAKQKKSLEEQASGESDPDIRQKLLDEAKDWSEGGRFRIALHTLAGAAAGGLGGATGAAVTSKIATTLDELQTKSIEVLKNAGLGDDAAKAAAGVLTSLAAMTTGVVVGGASGAMMGLGVDANNRQLHPTEKARIKELAGKNAEKEARLTAAACAMVHCYAEYPVSSLAYRDLFQLALLGASDELAGERFQLSNQSGLFGYSTSGVFSDANVDALKQINNTYQISTRTVGAGQAVLGSLGVAASVTTAPAACATGVGCLANTVVGTVSLDTAYAGARQAVSGESESTYLNKGLQSLGMSPEAAAWIEVALGVSSAIRAGAATGIPTNNVISENSRALATNAIKDAEKYKTITFKTAHYASRLESVGVNVSIAESAVARDVILLRENLATNVDFVGRIKVDGVLIEYRARLLKEGTLNIGTIFPVR